jgi:ABC-type multidrug transport system ATPase subunit
LDVNGKFSKFGAFVQQDDILLESFTCREHLRFAAMIRCANDLNNQEIENRVD